MEIAVREEAVITGGIWVPFPEERTLSHTWMSPQKVGFSYVTDIPFTGVPVNFSESFELIDCLAHPVHFCFSCICLQVVMQLKAAICSCLVIVRYGSQRQSNLFKGIIPLGLAPHLVPLSWWNLGKMISLKFVIAWCCTWLLKCFCKKLTSLSALKQVFSNMLHRSPSRFIQN